MKSFKEYREEKKHKKESMETSFGSHSRPKTNSMETSFGSHSRVTEKVSPDDYPRLSTEEHDHIHKKVAPIKKLAGDELEAVKDYSDESQPINSMLHRHDKGYDISTSNTREYRNTTNHLDTALNKHKTGEDMHVYTGIKYSPARHFKKIDGKIPDKHVLNLPAYTSTSSSMHSAREFSEHTMHPNDDRHGIEHSENGEARHVIKIHVPKGSHAMSLMKHSFVPAEKEVLLHRGHDIEIDKNPEHVGNNTYLWHARVVGHKPVDLSKSEIDGITRKLP